MYYENIKRPPMLNPERRGGVDGILSARRARAKPKPMAKPLLQPMPVAIDPKPGMGPVSDAMPRPKPMQGIAPGVGDVTGNPGLQSTQPDFSLAQPHNYRTGMMSGIDRERPAFRPEVDAILRARRRGGGSI